MSETLLGRERTTLVIIDLQKKLLEVIARRQEVVRNIRILIRLSQLFDLPIILTEQYAKMLGSTVKELTDDISSFSPIGKMEFNCCDAAGFTDQILSTKARNIILTGVESHICVFQTCVSLIEKGYTVHVPEDAVGSRTDQNLRAGLGLMNRAGAVITSTEAIVFQVLKKAGTREFKEMLKLIK